MRHGRAQGNKHHSVIIEDGEIYCALEFNNLRWKLNECENTNALIMVC
jgi:hypothetical protein